MELPSNLDLQQLPRSVRAELRSLTPEKAETVGGHLLMAGRLIDDDPQTALQHATAAKELASRLPIVREAVGESAYAAGAFGEALSEFRAVRRMTGTDEYLPAMADCERALGRTQSALKLVREGLAATPDAVLEIELRLVEAGIRADRGQADEALRLLQAEIESIGTRGTKLARARLRYAYADLLEQLSRPGDAERWFEAAAKLDPDESTDAADRLARLRGIVIEFDEAEEDDLEEDDFDEDDDATGVVGVLDDVSTADDAAEAVADAVEDDIVEAIEAARDVAEVVEDDAVEAVADIVDAVTEEVVDAIDDLKEITEGDAGEAASELSEDDGVGDAVIEVFDEDAASDEVVTED